MSTMRYEHYKDSEVEWLGKVPSHWRVDRLKASIQTCRNGIWGEEALGDENDIPCVRVADFDRRRLRVELSEPTIRNVTEKERAGRVLLKGDLLLEKSGGGENQPVGCVVLYDDARPAVCSNFVARMVAAPGQDSSYWRYVHAAAYGIRLTVGSINQTSGLQNLDQDRYFNEYAAFPPQAEQAAIAAFLDREAGKIDALVEEQRCLIDLLKEKRQAVISQAVTKGLNPHVPMKDSGVDWLGKVPAHWDVLRVKAASTFLTSGPRGWSDHVSDDGALFVQSGDLTEALGIDFDNAKRVVVADDAEAKRTQLKVGDVLVCITGAKTGKVAVCEQIDEPAFINQHICLIRPAVGLRPTYLGAYLHSAAGQRYFELAQYGLKQGLSLENVKQAAVPVPPQAEQDQIVDHVNRLATELDALTEAAEMSIALLHERRAAIISAAVTGKVDVRILASQTDMVAA